MHKIDISLAIEHFQIEFFNRWKLSGSKKFKFTHLGVLLRQNFHEKKGVQELMSAPVAQNCRNMQDINGY